MRFEIIDERRKQHFYPTIHFNSALNVSMRERYTVREKDSIVVARNTIEFYCCVPCSA